MQVYSSLYIGNYFLFLVSACDTAPLKIYFKDHDTAVSISDKTDTGGWKEKIFLYPALLQRKWIDYRYRDRFIPAVSYDNIMPVELRSPIMTKVNETVELRLKTIDKSYKSVRIVLIDEEGRPTHEVLIPSLPVNKEYPIRFTVDLPGVYSFRLFLDERPFIKPGLLVYRKQQVFTVKTFFENANANDWTAKNRLFCTVCGCPLFPIETDVIDEYLHKNYIPFKEYLDYERLGFERISSFMRTINHPEHFKQGLIHLLNMLRLASLDDELTIVKNLFRDDPPFAHHITDRLFLFDMIPVMPDRELQFILNKIDDELIARAMNTSGKDICDKLLKNISRRRGEMVLAGLRSHVKRKDAEKAKSEINRNIKSFFEERYGRELKIPASTRIIHRVKSAKDFPEKPSLDEFLLHEGDIAIFDGRDCTVLKIDHRNEKNATNSSIESTGNDREILRLGQSTPALYCLKFDSEMTGDTIFQIAGVTENTLFLFNRFGILSAQIHTYNWITSLENIESLENVPGKSILPFVLPSFCFVLTIGAVDSRKRPHEQVIRVKIHPYRSL